MKDEELTERQRRIGEIYLRFFKAKRIVPILLLYAGFIILFKDYTGGGLDIVSFFLQHGLKILGIALIGISIASIIASFPSLKGSEISFYDVDRAAKIKNEKLREELTSAQAISKEIRKQLGKKGGDAKRFELSGFEDFREFYSRTVFLLVQKANLADEKASILLDKGISFTKFGIGFFLFSIVAWQLVAHFAGFTDQIIFGIASTSFLFLFIEFLSAWFLRQYKNFTDTSTYLLKIKAVIDRYMFSYLAIDEFSHSPRKSISVEYLLKLIEKEIKWPNLNSSIQTEENFAKDFVSSISDFTNSIRKDRKYKDK